MSAEGIARLERIHEALQARINSNGPDAAELRPELEAVARTLHEIIPDQLQIQWERESAEEHPMRGWGFKSCWEHGREMSTICANVDPVI